MENWSQTDKAVFNAIVMFFVCFIPGCVAIALGNRYAKPPAISLGWVLIIMGIVFGILIYIWMTRSKRLPGTKKTFVACVLIGMMLAGFSTTRTVKTTNTEEVPTFSTTNVFNSTLQMSNVSGFEEYSITSMTEIQVGETIDIVLQVNDAQDLYCWSFDITWNGSILLLYDYNEGSFLKAGYQTIFTHAGPYGPIYNYISTLTQCRKGDVPGASGYGVIVWFTFKAIAPGTTTISISDAKWIHGTTLTRHNFPAIDPMQIVVLDPPPSNDGSSGGGKIPVIC
jgi:hypothetical protein